MWKEVLLIGSELNNLPPPLVIEWWPPKSECNTVQALAGLVIVWNIWNLPLAVTTSSVSSFIIVEGLIIQHLAKWQVQTEPNTVLCAGLKIDESALWMVHASYFRSETSTQKSYHSTMTRHIRPLLDQRRRRWVNIAQTKDQYAVLAGIYQWRIT